MLLLLMRAAHAFCSEPVEIEEVRTALTEAEKAYEAFDETAFRDRVNEVTAILLPCVSDPLPTDLVHRHHRAIALQLSLVGDERGAAAAIAASKRVDPQATLPVALVPDVHPLREAFEQTLEPRQSRVPEPLTGSIAFDGLTTRRRPTGQPTIVQLFDGRGAALSTHYIAPGESLPPYRMVPKRRRALCGIAIGSAVAGTGSYVAALLSKGSLKAGISDPAATRENLVRRRDGANVLTATSGVFFGISIGSASAAAIIGER